MADLTPTGTPPEWWDKLKPLSRQMRSDPTAAEAQLWQCVRNRQLAGFKFRRQHAIERFIVDFYCVERNLIVEIDGFVHEYTAEYDAVRQEYLESLGLRVIRFENGQVLENLPGVLKSILEALNPLANSVGEGAGGEVPLEE